MNSTRTVSRRRQEQTPTLKARADTVASGRNLGWMQRFWQWCAGCLSVSRRHRGPPRPENGWDVHHKRLQPSATADSLDRLTQERPALRMTIYTSLWR